jgi:hypothetical protein
LRLLRLFLIVIKGRQFFVQTRKSNFKSDFFDVLSKSVNIEVIPILYRASASRIMMFIFIFTEENGLPAVMALVCFWLRATMLATMHEWVAICVIVSASLETADPWIVARDICTAVRAIESDSRIVENSAIQDQCNGQGQEQSKPSPDNLFRHEEQNEKQ